VTNCAFSISRQDPAIFPGWWSSSRARIGAEVEIDAVDFQESTIEIARTLSADFPEIHYHCANIHEFGGNQSYDILLFSLALHHFSQEACGLRRCR
jgi:2-polyprenyl-3-methyl-5-hydroxy-6-metoxy-1,4-benzoquinol methylase